ncbi:cadherin repeat domain-containing protein [Microvirga soli]|uniref:cadherin repeat domain-containing protein n=1 Tax=Microvirga soli TaxID=1854496 RepID=UPI00191F84E6|nr:cadherin repeat domain-containing protein [Microvirga soli]
MPRNLRIIAADGFTNPPPDVARFDKTVIIQENIQSERNIGILDGFDLNGSAIDPATMNLDFYFGNENPGDAEGRYEITTAVINGVTRYVIKVKPNNGGEIRFNYEDLAQHEIAYRFTDKTTKAIRHEGTFTFVVSDINEAPTNLRALNATGGASLSVVENQGANTFVANLSSIDQDRTTSGGDGDTFAYSITTNPGNRFKLDATGRQLQLTGPLDYEATDPLLKTDGSGKYYDVGITVTDGGGAVGGTPLSTTTTIKVYVTNDIGDDINSRPTTPTIVDNAVVTLTESAAGARNVATVVSTDDGVGGTTLQYEMVNGVNGLFSINPTSGVITFNGTAQNYENNTNLQVENAGTAQERKFFNVQVRAKESGTNGQTSDTTTVKVYLDDVNEAVSDATYAVNVMSENAEAGTTVGTVTSVADPDTFVGNRDFRFTLVTPTATRSPSTATLPWTPPRAGSRWGRSACRT